MEHLNKYLEVALAIHAACSAICALTPTPKDDKVVRKLYRLIEIGGLVIGRAKQRWLIRQDLRPKHDAIIVFNPFFSCVSLFFTEGYAFFFVANFPAHVDADP